MATAIPDDFKRVGYENGKIPDCALSPVPSLANIKLHPQAAEQLGKLLTKAKEDSISFSIGSGYRTFDTQVQTKYKQGRGAASPGKSNHGWGTTIDISELYSVAETTAYDMNKTLPAANKVDKFSPTVHDSIRKTNRLYQWLSRNAPLYGWVNPEWAKDGKGTVDECWHWEYQAWPSLPSTVPAQNRPTTKPVESACGENTPIRTTYARYATGATPPTSSITPFIGTIDSFHPNIQYELTKRRVSKETANTYMPFVKLTSLVNVYGENIQEGTPGELVAWCPSLGPHGEDNITFEDIYLPQNNRSIVGYATTAITQGSEVTKPRRVPLIVSDNTQDQQRIPMPGISEMSVERGTAGPMGVRGGLVKADIKILAHSIGQVNTLLRYFLRPATRVVLEMGRRSSNPSETINPYDWNTVSEVIANEYIALIGNPEAQTEFIRKYVYGNNGNYEIFLCYVVKFDLKYNKNNIYEITLTVHSVQQFEIPTIQTGVKSICTDAVDKCKAMDIREYFDETYSWKPNSFKKLMSSEEVKAAPDSTATTTRTGYSDNFIAIKNPTSGDTGPGSKEAGLDENEYFVSWRFFVEKILNDNDLGVISVIPEDTVSPTKEVKSALSAKELLKLGLLRPVKELTPAELDEAKTQVIANEVGYHPNLRSTDPNVMIIYNETAQADRDLSDTQQYEILGEAVKTTDDEPNIFRDNSSIVQFMEGSSVGKFSNIADDSTKAGSGLLSQGVWLNTKAIKQAFNSTDTVTAAINSLLSMMNAATQGYWNLQLYSTDRTHSGLFVIDMGLSKRLEKTTDSANNTQAKFPDIDREEDISPTRILNTTTLEVDKIRYQKSITEPDKPKYLYMFNRKTKVSPEVDLGSDLLDLNVEFNLPQVIAVQAIAGIGGPTQKSTLESIDIEELHKISFFTKLFTSCSANTICNNEDCEDRSDLSSLETRMNAVKAEFNTRVQQEKIESGSAQFIQLRQNLDNARSDYYRAKIQSIYGSPMVVDTARELSSLGTLLKFVEFNPAAMLRKMNRDSRNAEEGRAEPPSHAFSSSNLTKTLVSVTLPGIGGIELFQSFVVDRVPSILERGYYVVTKVIHKFSPSGGWLTTIEGRFRYRPIQKTIGKSSEYEVKCVPAPAGAAATQPSPGTLSQEAQQRLGAPASKPVSQFTNDEIVRRTNTILELTNSFWGRYGSSATRDAYNKRVADGTVARLQNELRIIDDEAVKRVKTTPAAQRIPREFQGKYFAKLVDRLEPRGIKFEWNR